MDCKKVRGMIDIHSTDIPEDLEAHLRQCKACRDYHNDLLYLRSLPLKPGKTSATPDLLKAHTLELCRNIIAQKSTGKTLSLSERIKLVWQSPKFVLTVALAALVALAIMAGMAGGQNGSDALPSQAMQILLFVLVQNFLIAVFSPLILVYFKIR